MEFKGKTSRRGGRARRRVAEVCGGPVVADRPFGGWILSDDRSGHERGVGKCGAEESPQFAIVRGEAVKSRLRIASPHIVLGSGVDVLYEVHFMQEHGVEAGLVPAGRDPRPPVHRRDEAGIG